MPVLMASDVTTSPGRGRYDRAASASERAQRARKEILLAVRELLPVTGEQLSVHDVIARAGLGRNTFYGHFTDVAEAVRVAGQEAFAELLAHDGEWVASGDTPRSAVEGFARDWFERVGHADLTYRVVSIAARDELRAWLAERLLELHALGARAGLFRQSLERPRLVAALGLMSALADDLANGPASECELVASQALTVLFR